MPSRRPSWRPRQHGSPVERGRPRCGCLDRPRSRFASGVGLAQDRRRSRRRRIGSRRRDRSGLESGARAGLTRPRPQALRGAPARWCGGALPEACPATRRDGGCDRCLGRRGRRRRRPVGRRQASSRPTRTTSDASSRLRTAPSASSKSDRHRRRYWVVGAGRSPSALLPSCSSPSRPTRGSPHPSPRPCVPYGGACPRRNRYTDNDRASRTGAVHCAASPRPAQPRDMHPMLNIGVRAARAAGRTITQGIGRLDTVRFDAKGPRDFVSEIDRKAEADIIGVLDRAYPDHAVLGEESGLRARGSGVPLGRGPARRHDELPARTAALLGVDRAAEERQAVPGHRLRPHAPGALHGRQGRRGVPRRQAHSRVQDRATRRGAARHRLSLPGGPVARLYQRTSSHFTEASGGIRRLGSAALDLAYVAAGRLDGCWLSGCRHGTSRPAH